MHFFYLDEAGCNGSDLTNPEQPVFVSGGIIVRDEGWNKTNEMFTKIIHNYFNKNVPKNFELHSNELFSPEGNGPFLGHSRERRNNLANNILDLIIERSHSTAYCAIEKSLLIKLDNSNLHPKNYFNTKIPYLLAYDYLISSFEKYTKESLGRSARGMIIIDIKDEFSKEIAEITNHCRYNVPNNQRVKWLTEFTYSVDSKKNPMIQCSDLICYITKKFLEIDKGYRNEYPSEVKNLYRDLYKKIHDRVIRKSVLEISGRQFEIYNRYMNEAIIFPRIRFASTNY